MVLAKYVGRVVYLQSEMTIANVCVRGRQGEKCDSQRFGSKIKYALFVYIEFYFYFCINNNAALWKVAIFYGCDIVQ